MIFTSFSLLREKGSRSKAKNYETRGGISLGPVNHYAHEGFCTFRGGVLDIHTYRNRFTHNSTRGIGQ